jgi:hypothetical protein
MKFESDLIFAPSQIVALEHAKRKCPWLTMCKTGGFQVWQLGSKKLSAPLFVNINAALDQAASFASAWAF